MDDATPSIPAARPTAIMFFPNGNVAVLDAAGQQMPRYQRGWHQAAISLLEKDGINWRELEIDGFPQASPPSHWTDEREAEFQQEIGQGRQGQKTATQTSRWTAVADGLPPIGRLVAVRLSVCPDPLIGSREESGWRLPRVAERTLYVTHWSDCLPQ